MNWGWLCRHAPVAFGHRGCARPWPWKFLRCWCRLGPSIRRPRRALVTTEKHCLLSVHLPLFRLSEHYVHFVRHQPNHTRLWSHLSDLFKPTVDIAKRVQVCYVEDNDDAVRPSVIMRSYRIVFLASWSVPNLHVYGFVVLHFNDLARELNSNCWLLIIRAWAIYIVLNDARLANVRIPCQDNFEKHVVVAFVVWFKATVITVFRVFTEHCYRLWLLYLSSFRTISTCN